MSAPIGPGDYVEAVITRTDKQGNRLVAGKIYTCRGFRDVQSICDRCSAPGPAIVLTEHAAPNAWCTCELRPIYRRSNKILKSVLEPVEEAVSSRSPITAVVQSPESVVSCAAFDQVRSSVAGQLP